MYIQSRKIEGTFKKPGHIFNMMNEANIICLFKMHMEAFYTSVNLGTKALNDGKSKSINLSEQGFYKNKSIQ